MDIGLLSVKKTRGGQHVRRQREKGKVKSVGLKVGTLNVGMRQGGRTERLEALEQGPNCTIMVWIGRETG